MPARCVSVTCEVERKVFLCSSGKESTAHFGKHFTIMGSIRLGIEEISNSVQDNSAAAEETSATSEELAAQANILTDMVQHFDLGE